MGVRGRGGWRERWPTDRSVCRTAGGVVEGKRASAWFPVNRPQYGLRAYSSKRARPCCSVEDRALTLLPAMPPACGGSRPGHASRRPGFIFPCTLLPLPASQTEPPATFRTSSNHHPHETPSSRIPHPFRRIVFPHHRLRHSAKRHHHDRHCHQRRSLNALNHFRAKRHEGNPPLRLCPPGKILARRPRRLPTGPARWNARQNRSSRPHFWP